MTKMINRHKARIIGHSLGIQISENALCLLDEAAEKTIRLGAERTKALGKKRLDDSILRGTLPGP